MMALLGQSDAFRRHSHTIAQTVFVAGPYRAG
jgi:hypothetical protein